MGEKKVLFLPFLRIPSGHHQVANALIEELQLNVPDIECQKAEILSYSYGKAEAIISGAYLKWIHLLPHSYNWLYQQSVYKNIEQEKEFKLYKWLFLAKMKRLLKEYQPDGIVCTHALPSYMLNVLKENDTIQIPVINVYTDFFIHQFWGTTHIDFHFVSCPAMKELLMDKGIPEHRILFTGIPIHHEIKTEPIPLIKQRTQSLSILVTGGNLGVGAMEQLISSLKPSGRINYFVLCGKNIQLYQKLRKLNHRYIIPLDYISCRKKMNQLYDLVDGILTKPGGVTISEALRKRKPIFIFHALPGQEMINLDQLQQLGVVNYLNDWGETESQLISFFESEEQLRKVAINLENYHNLLTDMSLTKLIDQIL